MSAVIPKFAAQAIRKVYDLGWKPTFFLSMPGNSDGAVMGPAGPEKGIGISGHPLQRSTRRAVWQDTPDYKEGLAWMKKIIHLAISATPSPSSVIVPPADGDHHAPAAGATT